MPPGRALAAVDEQVAGLEPTADAGEVGELVGRGRMVEAPARGVPVRVTGLRGGWLAAVRPGAGR